jgi:sugar lactone lactonase YvrE
MMAGPARARAGEDVGGEPAGGPARGSVSSPGEDPARGGWAAEPVGDVIAELGEGPYWDAASGTLLWVDIPAGTVHATGPSTGVTATACLGAPVSAALPAEGGGLLVARRNRLVVCARPGSAGPGPGTERVVAEVPMEAGLRFNDAACDPRGRVWVGSMHIGCTLAAGTLYRLDPGGVLTGVIAGVTISNGLGWSPSGSRMYYVDTPTRRIDVLDYDIETGAVSGRRMFADLTGADGRPDGLTVDAEGCVWVALPRGGALHRYGPDGRLDTVLPLPVSRPTSCTFGGPDLADLYVTTASAPLTGAERASQPLAGRLLRLRPGATGISPVPLARLP